MEWTGAAVSLGWKFLSWIERIWCKRRYRARIRLDLDWNGIPIIFLGSKNPFWRAVRITVTASKDAEFIIASGSFEGRKSGTKRFTKVAEISELLQLPLEIQANRQAEYRVSGGTLANNIRRKLNSELTIDIRAIVRDYHNIELVSEPITVTLTELEREERR